AQPSLSLPHRDGAKHAPIDLGTLARGKGQGEKGGLSAGADGAGIGFDQGIAIVKPLLPQALDDLSRGIGIAVQQAANLRFEGSEFAGVGHGSKSMRTAPTSSSMWRASCVVGWSCQTRPCLSTPRP